MLGFEKAAGLLLLVLGLLAGCSAVPPTAGSLEPAATLTASPGSTSTSTATQHCGGADLAVDRGPYVIAGMRVPGYGIPDMGGQKVDVALRTAVVTGTVTTRDAAFFAEPGDVYTPFSVEVDRVIRGDARVGQMHVAVEGGTVGCYTLQVYYGAPLVETGKRYIFFLGEPVGTESARAYWDAWLVGANNVVQTVQGPMPLAELIDRIHRLPAAAGSSTP